MKRILCLTITLALLFSCSWAKCDSIQFTPTNTQKLDYSEEEWLSTFSNRTLLALFLTLDFIFDTGYDVEDIDFSAGAYVFPGVALHVLLYTNGQTLLITYDPSDAYANYGFLDTPAYRFSNSKAWITGIKEVLDNFTMYHVPEEALLHALTLLSEIMNN